jgi:hypothetical protein
VLKPEVLQDRGRLDLAGLRQIADELAALQQSAALGQLLPCEGGRVPTVAPILETRSCAI